ncbi:hypothetical protein NDU88_005805, partial [Pleurodeles waltl]
GHLVWSLVGHLVWYPFGITLIWNLQVPKPKDSCIHETIVNDNPLKFEARLVSEDAWS